MKIYILLLLLSASILTKAQSLDSTKWKGNISYFLSDTTSAFTLEGLTRTDKWVSFTRFENGIIYAYNMGWCGTECHQMFYGNYTQNGDVLTLQADSVTFSGFCDNEPTKVLKVPTQTFVLREEGDNIILIRKEE